MTKKMIFIFKVRIFNFLFYFRDDLTLNDMTLILNVDMNVNVPIEAHETYDKSFILMKKVIKKIYLKFGQILKIIFLKLKI
jgi:hypothetical protein